MIQKIIRVPLREAFPHEARDLTRWLKENLDVLNGVIDITLTSAEREQAAGDFSVDLVAEDSEGRKVVIENQLERSNHDHLGKLLTYLVAVEATSAIWIVSDPRPEHIRAIAWLNESSSASFYLLKLETVRIGSSDPAPLLTLIVGPSAEAKAVGRSKKEFTERHVERLAFWTQLLSHAKQRTQLHAAIKPGPYHWQGAGAGKGGLGFNYVLWEDQTAAELYIDRDKTSGAENKAIFDQFYVKRAEIENAFGGKLEWERLDSKRASRIRFSIKHGGWRGRSNWDGIIKDTVDAMVRLENALRPHIQKLSLAEL